MDLGIAGKVALVFGASRGLGKAVAQRLVGEGCRVIAVARSAGPLEEAVRDIKEAVAAEGAEVIPLRCDIGNQASIQALLSQVRAVAGDPEIVVYNNGGPPDHSFDEATDDHFLAAYASQVLGFAWVVREVVPAMKQQQWGRIVTLSSRVVKEPHREVPMVLHNLTRPAAAGLSKTLSVDLGTFGVTVNTIGTGLIDGGEDNSFRRTYREAAKKKGVAYEDLIAARLRLVPAGRAGRPDEVASLCAFLCSQCAGFLTGQTIILDGGQVSALY